MRYLFFLFILFLCPINVWAKDLYLDSLEIKNGELSLPFDRYNTQYTVSIAKDINVLDIVYNVSKGIDVEIWDNHDLQNDSMSTISLTEDSNNVKYELHILKEDEEVAPVFFEPNNDSQNNFMYKYKIFIIPPICIFLILLLFKILFLRKKKFF